MKTILGTLWFYSTVSAALAQGLVNFINTSSTLVSDWRGNVISGPPGAYYFALLIGPSPAGPFYFSGIYATNTAPGLFSGGLDVPVTIWMPGATRSYEVAGWSGDLGPTFNPSWLTSGFPTNGLMGFSVIGTGVAGGFDGSQSFPALDLFGGSGIQSGFYLWPPVIPEPAIAALAGLGLTMSLVYQRVSASKSQG